MGIIDYINKIKSLYKKKEDDLPKNSIVSYPDEYKKVLAFNRKFEELMRQDIFIARSNYKDLKIWIIR